MKIPDLFKFFLPKRSIARPSQQMTKSTAMYLPDILNNINLDLVAKEADKVILNLGKSRDYLKVLEYDAEVYQCFDTRRDFVVTTPINIKSDNEDLESFLKSELSKRTPELMRSMYDAVKYGYNVSAIQYKQNSDGTIGLGGFVAMPMEYFNPRQSGQWQGQINGVETDLNPLQWHVLVRNPTYEMQRGESVLSRVFWSCQFKKQGQNFWAQWLERWASPTLVGKSPADMLPDGETTMISDMAATLAEAVRNRVIVVNDSQDVTALETGGTGDAFLSFDSTMKNEIQKIILGSGSVSQTENNNRASGRTGENTLEQKVNSDLRLMVEGLQMLADDLIEINRLYGVDFGLGAKAEISVQTTEDIKLDLAARDKLLTESGVKLTNEYWKRTYALTDTDIAESQAIEQQTPTPQTVQASFSLADNKFTAEQMAIEDLGDSALKLGSPINPDDIIKALESDGDPVQNLLSLLDKSNEAWNEALEKHLFAAHVLGYVHTEETAKQLDEAENATL